MVGLCYCALFLNIGAAIGGFIIIDGLGEMHYHAASAANQLHSQGGMPGSTMELVVRYDGGSYWRWLVYHCESCYIFLFSCFTILIHAGLFSFGAGILSLILLLIVFICSQENAGVIAVSIGLGLFTLVPVGFVFFNNRPPKRYAQLPHAPSPSVVSRPPLQHASQSPRDYMMSGTPVDKNELAVITGGQAIDGFSATRNP